MVTATSLAVIRPAVVTDDERLASRAIREQRMRADVRFLSSDLLEGRAPGTRGDLLARAYVASRFEAIGLEPGVLGAWEQPVELVGATAKAPDTVRVTRGTESAVLRQREDFIAWSGRHASEVEIKGAEIVFVGYGIVAPEYGWDDYKGADLRGKVLLFMNNDPEGDPALFAGKTRLYYGRWDYKYEMAAERGAAGAIIIHTNASAGYGWQVVQTSWTGEILGLPESGQAHSLSRPGLPRTPAGGSRSSPARTSTRCARAPRSRDFRPVPLGVSLDVVLQNELVRRQTANVIGRLPGRDPALAKEAVLYTAHHDHLGIKASASGEPADLQRRARQRGRRRGDARHRRGVRGAAGAPRRSILFAAVAAEEQGLLGSQYLAGTCRSRPASSPPTSTSTASTSGGARATSR